MALVALFILLKCMMIFNSSERLIAVGRMVFLLLILRMIF